MQIDFDLDLEVGSLDAKGNFCTHSIYSVTGNSDINSLLKNLIDDEYSTHAQLKTLSSIDSEIMTDVTVAYFKKIKTKSGKYRWIVDD